MKRCYLENACMNYKGELLGIAFRTFNDGNNDYTICSVKCSKINPNYIKDKYKFNSEETTDVNRGDLGAFCEEMIEQTMRLPRSIYEMALAARAREEEEGRREGISDVQNDFYDRLWNEGMSRQQQSNEYMLNYYRRRRGEETE